MGLAEEEKTLVETVVAMLPMNGLGKRGGMVNTSCLDLQRSTRKPRFAPGSDSAGCRFSGEALPQ